MVEYSYHRKELHMNYSPEYKEAILRRMLPPNNESITKIAKEEGLSETGAIKPERKELLHLAPKHSQMTGALRISSLL